MGIPLVLACEPPMGSVTGKVTVEGTGIDGVLVTLSTGDASTTAADGVFRFDGIQAGTYSVTISNYPPDASFLALVVAATVETDGQVVTVNFPGSWIRTSAIIGSVTAEGEALTGVTVTASGTEKSQALTDGNGLYSVSNLRMGTYTIEISGYDTEEYEFGRTAATETVGLGESRVVAFEGTYVRASAIAGQVSVEGEGLDGVTASLQGKGENLTTTTNAAGQYLFEKLRKGDYSIEISGYDTEEVGFETTSKAVLVEYGETASVPFEGTYVRASAIAGQVSVEGEGLDGVTASLQGKGENLTTTTNAAGQYLFEKLRKGDYSIEISGYDTEEVGFETTSKAVLVEYGETASVPFEGTYVRASAIAGQVSVEGEGLDGVTASLQGKGENLTTTTNAAGQYLFEKLRKGDYSIEISGYDTEEVGFETTSKAVAVGYGETASVPFEGTYLRASSIMVQVSIDGTGLADVTVSLQGKGETREAHTNAAGQYVFEDLRRGNYSIGISGYDDDEYGFDVTSKTVTVARGETGNVPFEGIALRTAGIKGTVTVTDHGPLDGVTVTVSGGPKDEEYRTTTNAAGMYEIDRLHAGDYSVAISGYDTEEYEFDVTTKSVSVGLRETAEVAFDGTKSQ